MLINQSLQSYWRCVYIHFLLIVTLTLPKETVLKQNILHDVAEFLLVEWRRATTYITLVMSRWCLMKRQSLSQMNHQSGSTSKLQMSPLGTPSGELNYDFQFASFVAWYIKSLAVRKLQEIHRRLDTHSPLKPKIDPHKPIDWLTQIDRLNIPISAHKSNVSMQGGHNILMLIFSW